MAAKYLLVLVLAYTATQGQCLTEIILQDRATTFLSNPFIAFNMGIAKPIFDKLVSCQVMYPNGVIYEAFPNNNLIHDEITFANAVEPFNSCSIHVLNAPPSLSGTYELFSVVESNIDSSRTLTRQKNHVQFYFSDSWGVPQNKK